MGKMVEIDEDELRRLQRDSEWLLALEAAGVDNWEGYDIAIDIRDERQNETEIK